VKKATLSKYLGQGASLQTAMTAEADPPSLDLARGSGRFVGSKGGAGVWQRIISEMPPHDLYVEAFAGTGQVLLHKRPAQASIAIDSDAAVCAGLKRSLNTINGDGAGVTVVCGDAISWLEKHRGSFTAQTVLYCDPPYLFDVRACPGRRYYGHEFGEEWLHGELLAVLSRIDSPVLISGYRSALYDRMLADWRRIDYQTATRGGGVTESLWCNFDAPAQLHDYRFLGTGFRERERIKRKKARWLTKLRRMTPVEAAAVLAAIDEWRRAL
jgi:site-specific DNA-adenine methylase